MAARPVMVLLRGDYNGCRRGGGWLQLGMVSTYVPTTWAEVNEGRRDGLLQRWRATELVGVRVFAEVEVVQQHRHDPEKLTSTLEGEGEVEDRRSEWNTEGDPR